MTRIYTNQNLIKSKRGLAKLFDSPTLPLQLQFNTAMADLTLQFFYTVKKQNWLHIQVAKVCTRRLNSI
ncbi:hypothetical protein A3860_34180 [Niastella vici]|uniref:Uncharacterized protein n=2 Tax=Niastella vici TaxID=1703345 RepID=A0A1V9FQ58_9BACT|nr:hypothetical protein A3860_34180 [Niastella vici]